MSEDHPEVAKAKRKRNRKKKKKTKATNTVVKDDESVASSNSGISFQASKSIHQPTIKTSTTLMTPQERVRERLISEGNSTDEIDEAMEQMWDKGLAYDEYDAVVKFLENGGNGDDGDEEASNEEKDPGDQATVLTASTEDAVGEGESMSNSASVQDADEDNESATKPPSSPPKMSLAEKLNMVARADKVTDAIFALTQWINKAAKPHELEDLCMARNTKALVIVFQRGMEECVDQNMFDSAVLPGLVQLIFHTFRRCGIEFKGSDADAAIESMENLLKQTRKVVMIKPIDEADRNNDIADKVANFVVSRMAAAMDEAKYCLVNPQTVKIPTMTSKIKEARVSSLINKRESQKLAAKRAATIARSSIEKMLPPGTSASLNDSGFSLSATLDNSTLQLVDDATKARFDARKARLDELKAQMNDGESEKVKALRASVNDLELERSTVQKKIGDLRMMLQKLEAEDKDLSEKIGALEEDISEEQLADSEETKKLQEQVRKAKEEAKYGNLVGSLSGMMKGYAKTVETATTKSVQSTEGLITPAELASNKMETYLQQILTYFQTDSEILTQLKSRLEANNSELSALKIELEQVAGLGMSTTTGQIEDSIAAKEETIKSDSEMLVTFISESSSMLDDFVGRLETYTAASNVSGELQSISNDILLDIKAEIEDSGIAVADKLKKYIQDSRPSSPVVMTRFTENTASSVATPSPLANGKKTKKLIGAEGLPKLTWAATSQSVMTTEKPSFLDIQREELQSKI